MCQLCEPLNDSISYLIGDFFSNGIARKVVDGAESQFIGVPQFKL